MDATSTEARFTPPSPQATPPRLPTVWSALGLIALYFVLQLGVGILVGLGIGIMTGLTHGAGAGGAVRAVLARPDISAIMVMLTLVISATVTLMLARRLWPSMWHLGTPPGFGFAQPANPMYYVIALTLGLAMPFLGGLLTQWLAQGHEVSQDIKQLGAVASPFLRVPLALLIVTLGPLVEEVLFRGVLLSSVGRHVPAGTATIITALLFACVHLPDLGYLWYAVPNLFLLGVVLALLRLHSGSIWPAVLAHGVNNALAVVSWFLVTQPTS